MSLSVDTLNAVTEAFWVEKNMVSQCFRSTPVWEYLKRGARKAGGVSVQFPIEYARLGGGSRALNGQMTLTTPEIATKATGSWRHYYVPVQLEQIEMEYNQYDPRAIANYLNMYTRSALDTMREKHLGVDIFKAQTSTALDSIVDAVSDSATYAGIAKSDIPSWQCVVAEGEKPSSYKLAVSPSIDNFRKMIRVIREVSGKKPDIIVTSGDVYDVLGQQVSVNDQVIATRSSQVVQWGYEAIHIDGVPVITDLNFEEQQCADFVASEDTRAHAAGHQALFLNFSDLFMYYLPSRWLSWDKMGWVSANDYTQYINKIHFSGNIICTSRRSQGRIYNIDPTQDPADWTLMSISKTPFAVV